MLKGQAAVLPWWKENTSWTHIIFSENRKALKHVAQGKSKTPVTGRFQGLDWIRPSATWSILDISLAVSSRRGWMFSLDAFQPKLFHNYWFILQLSVVVFSSCRYVSKLKLTKRRNKLLEVNNWKTTECLLVEEFLFLALNHENTRQKLAEFLVCHTLKNNKISTVSCATQGEGFLSSLLS